MSVSNIVATTNNARGKLYDLAQAMNLHIAGGSPARRLIDSMPSAPAVVAAARAVVAAAPAVVAAAPAADAFDRTLALLRPTDGAATAPAVEEAPGRSLGAGLAEVRAFVATSQPRLNDVLRLVLQTLHAALHFR
ncbi:MAG: hypothetical protein LH650_14935, partial [Chloroflexi bacterium]|nr:hypothetical protein [Chloroflexota bacterium]